METRLPTLSPGQEKDYESDYAREGARLSWYYGEKAARIQLRMYEMF